MRGIGGNVTATIQVKTFVRDEQGKYQRNEIGEVEKTWTDAQSIRGWLDLAGGDSRYTPYSAKIQESTHVFIADYAPIDERISAENARMVIGGKAYDIMLIDNPMGMVNCSQLEIYLKYTGGQ
jgi:hypothetical protein